MTRLLHLSSRNTFAFHLALFLRAAYASGLGRSVGACGLRTHPGAGGLTDSESKSRCPCRFADVTRCGLCCPAVVCQQRVVIMKPVSAFHSMCACTYTVDTLKEGVRLNGLSCYA